MREKELILSTWALVRWFRNWMQGKSLRTRPHTTSFWSHTLTIPSTTMQSTLLDSTMNDYGILADQYASSDFDVLTSEDLCTVLDLLSIGIMLAIGTKPQVRNPESYFPYLVQHVSHILVSSIHQKGNHTDFHQFVGSQPYVHYYHMWLIEIPLLSFLAVPQLNCIPHEYGRQQQGRWYWGLQYFTHCQWWGLVQHCVPTTRCAGQKEACLLLVILALVLWDKRPWKWAYWSHIWRPWKRYNMTRWHKGRGKMKELFDWHGLWS